MRSRQIPQPPWPLRPPSQLRRRLPPAIALTSSARSLLLAWPRPAHQASPVRDPKPHPERPTRRGRGPSPQVHGRRPCCTRADPKTVSERTTGAPTYARRQRAVPEQRPRGAGSPGRACAGRCAQCPGATGNRRGTPAAMMCGDLLPTVAWCARGHSTLARITARQRLQSAATRASVPGAAMQGWLRQDPATAQA